MLSLRIHGICFSHQSGARLFTSSSTKRVPISLAPRQPSRTPCHFSAGQPRRLASSQTTGAPSRISRNASPAIGSGKPASTLPIGSYRSSKEAKEDLMKTLAQSAPETELYRAPGLKMYHFSMCAFVCILWGCAVQTARLLPSLYDNPHLNLHWGIPVAYGGICVIFAGSAAFAFWRGTGAIKSIKALSSKNGLNLEISIIRPMLKPKVLRVNPADVFVDPVLAEGTRPAWSMADNKYLSHKQMQDLSRSTIRPTLWWLWYSFKRVLTQEGFSTVYIKNSWGSCKIDVNGTFADEGRTLYRLVSTPTEFNPALTSKRFY